MAVIIVDTGTAIFTLNGVSYLKNFQSLISGDSIRIVNAYDSRLELLSWTLYSEFTVDGSTFASAILLQENLVSKLFNRPATGSGLLETSTSNTLSFHNTAGVRHGTFAIPITGNLILNTTGSVEGGTVVIVWSGSSDPSFSSGTVQSYSGGITSAGTYSIYVHYLNGRFNVNIFNVDGDQPSIDVPSAPISLILTQGTTGVDTPNAPISLVLTEGIVSIVAPDAPTSLVLTEGTV